MEQFVLVPTSVYNKSWLPSQQELLKHQLSQTLAYQVDSLRKDINKELFSKVDSLEWLWQNFVLSTYQALKITNLIFDGVETAIFLWDLAQQLRR